MKSLRTALILAALMLAVPATASAADPLVSTGKPATASAVQDNNPATYGADKAFDQNTSTRWSTPAADPQWIRVDLGQSYNISRVRLNWEAAYGKSYQIQVSSDGTNWTSIYSTTTGDGGFDDLTVSGAGRYVRMNGTQRGTAWGYSLYEMEVYGTPTTQGADPLVSQGHTATSSSNESNSLLPANAVDGNFSTRWSSAFSDPQWLQVDLGQTYNVTHVKLTWETAYGKSYKIQTSNDAVNWTDIYSTTTGDGATDDLTGLNGTGRYVRMYGTVRGSVYGYSLYEFQVYGNTSGGGGDTIPPTAPALSGTAGNAQVTLNWSGATDNVGVTGYHVYRNGTQIGTPTGTTFTDTGLTNGTSYAYTVKANDAAGNLSPASNTVNLTPTGVVQPIGPPGSWALAWSDEFSGTSLDTSKWNCSGANNNHMSGAICSNITEANGEVKLSPDSGGHGAQMNSETDLTSAGYNLPVGGVAEARVYFPADPSDCHNKIYDWPAFWSSGPNWPNAGEIDTAEGLDQLAINYHSPSLNPPGPRPAGCWGNAFHTYTMWRQANQIQVYWDGVLQWTQATGDNGVGQGLILTQGYKQDGTDVYGDAGAVHVDYVRAWTPG